MKRINDSDLVDIYEYATRDGFLYSRSFFGSSYGEFVKNLCQLVRSGEITPEQAFDQIDKFEPSRPHPDNRPIDGDAR